RVEPRVGAAGAELRQRRRARLLEDALCAEDLLLREDGADAAGDGALDRLGEREPLLRGGGRRGAEQRECGGMTRERAQSVPLGVRPVDAGAAKPIRKIGGARSVRRIACNRNSCSFWFTVAFVFRM